MFGVDGGAKIQIFKFRLLWVKLAMDQQISVNNMYQAYF